MAGFELTRRSAAAPEQVFDVFADGAGWARWAGPLIRRSSWEQEGTPAPGGVGAIRVLGAGAYGSREQIIEYAPPERLAYTVLSGFPVRDYRATIELTPTTEGGTLIHWSASFRPPVPGTGALIAFGLRSMLGGFASRAAAYAERSEHRERTR
jgi:uncharacterized protein YndB with AHSA1/START domain